LGIRKILPQTRKLTDTKNIPQIDALITFTEKDLRSLQHNFGLEINGIF